MKVSPNLESRTGWEWAPWFFGLAVGVAVGLLGYSSLDGHLLPAGPALGCALGGLITTLGCAGGFFASL